MSRGGRTEVRIFKHPNVSNEWVCPICGTADDKPVTLIGISGTERDNIMQAEQFHIDCLSLNSLHLNDVDEHLIYMRYDDHKPGGEK